MKFKTKSHILKSGVQVKIRAPHIEEALGLLNLKRAYIKNTVTLPLTLDEYPMDKKKEVTLIKEYHKSENSILLVAELNSVFIGNIDLTGSKKSKTAHTAMTSISKTIEINIKQLLEVKDITYPIRSDKFYIL